MLTDLDIAIKFLLMPLISAQLVLIVLIYFTIVRKRISTLYKWYFCFLSTVILFLIGRSAQIFLTHDAAHWVLYTRVSLLFAVGMPSIMIASALYTDIKKSKTLFVLPYVIGTLFSLGYVICMDSNQGNLFSHHFSHLIPDFIPLNIAHTIQLVGIIVLLVIPCSYFLIRAIKNHRNTKDLAFLFGSLLFGILFAIGTYWGELYWIYYLGSIGPALCWAWAVFHDINEMKGKASLLKDELYELAQTERSVEGEEIDKLLNEIELLSSNNLVMYKLRLKEILSRLIDNSIEAGGDTDQLLSRYSQQEMAITQSDNLTDIRQIARDEVVGLSQLISDIPNLRVEKIKTYLSEHYQEDIDINQLAIQFKVSRSYLMREFKKATSQTVNQFLTARRIEIAQKLLVKHSVTETAFAVGFNNSNYFSTVFKKTTGKSPRQFQETCEPPQI